MGKYSKSKLSVEQMIAMRQSGRSLTDIAAEAGISIAAVSVRLTRSAPIAADQEGVTLASCVASIARLTDTERDRVMRYLVSRFGGGNG